MADSKFKWLSRHKAYLMAVTKNGTKDTINSTLHRVPQRNTYASWVNYYNSIKPIRGRDASWRPLGSRRDVDRVSFCVDKSYAGLGVVSFKCYNHNVMRWHEDETIEVYNTGWMHGYGVAMLTWLIPNMLGAYTKNGNIIAKYAADKAHKLPEWESGFWNHPMEEVVVDAPVMVIPKHVWFPLRKEGEFHVPPKVVNKKWAMNRTESKRIRGVYKEFTDYVRMTCNLLKDTPASTRVEFSNGFLQQYVTDPISDLEMDAKNKTNARFMEYLRHWQVLATSGDAEKMSAALGMLLASTMIPWIWKTHRGRKDGWQFHIGTVLDNLDRVILRAHAEEVLELVDVKEGNTPSTTYDDWSVGPAHSYRA